MRAGDQKHIILLEWPNDAIIKDKHAGSGEASALDGYLVSGKNCYLSNRTASKSTATSYPALHLARESFYPRESHLFLGQNDWGSFCPRRK